jgi:hypothetical protein
LSSEDGHKGSIYAVSWSPDGKQVSLVLTYNESFCGEHTCFVVPKPILVDVTLLKKLVNNIIIRRH